MPHFPKPYFLKARGIWKVQIRGKQHNLGADEAEAVRRYRALMAEPASRSVVSVLDTFLGWCKGHRAPDTYEWSRWRLEQFARHVGAGLAADRLKHFHIRRVAGEAPRLVVGHQARDGPRGPAGVPPGDDEGVRRAEPRRRLREGPALQHRMGQSVLRKRGVEPTEGATRELIPRLRPTCTVRKVTRPKTEAEPRQEARRKRRLRLAAEHAPKYCLYVLRHSRANHALARGVDALTAAILMGHRDPGTLARTYQHLPQNPAYLLSQAKKATA